MVPEFLKRNLAKHYLLAEHPRNVGFFDGMAWELSEVPFLGVPRISIRAHLGRSWLQLLENPNFRSLPLNPDPKP